MKIALLGSTGSIGKTTLRVAEHLQAEVTVLAAHSNTTLLAEQIVSHQPRFVALYDPKAAATLRKRFPHIEIGEGKEGLCDASSFDDVDVVVVAISGMAALPAVIAAIKKGKKIALANKEVLVAGGELVIQKAKECGALLLPVDSEHSALFQCLQKVKKEELRRLILTASGGPFRNFSQEDFAHITKDQALKHPVWKMGPKVTIDSSTLMNKGLEMIEAYYLFGQIPEVIVHPQHVIHSLIETIDGTLFAQMNEPDMSFPIQYALTYPQRKEGFMPPFDFVKHSRLEFYPVDEKKFPSIALARESLYRKKSYPTYLNGANEALVGQFLEEKVGFVEMQRKLEKLFEKHLPCEIRSVEDILAVDHLARQEAQQI